MTKPNPSPNKGRKKPPMNDMSTPIVPAVEAPKAPRTLDQKIAATEALLAKYIAERDNVAAVADIQVGDDVTFNYGRPLGSKVLSGRVTAVGDHATFGLTAVVQVGEGLDTELVKTGVRNITENRTAAERAAVDAPAADESDPLNAE